MNIDNLKTLVSMYPQAEDDRVNYLIGGDLGIELALEGTCINRIKKGSVEHSDKEYPLELFADIKPDIDNADVYNTSKTKYLHRLPNNLLMSSRETVVYKGNKYYVPSLEILFIDKFLSNSLDDENMYQLKMLYDLDLKAIKDHIKMFYLNYDVVIQDLNDSYFETIESLEELYENMSNDIVHYRKEKLEFDEFLSEVKALPNSTIIAGLRPYLVPDKVIMKKGKVSEKTKKEIKNLVNEAIGKEEDKLNRINFDLDIIFDSEEELKISV